VCCCAMVMYSLVATVATAAPPATPPQVPLSAHSLCAPLLLVCNVCRWWPHPAGPAHWRCRQVSCTAHEAQQLQQSWQQQRQLCTLLCSGYKDSTVCSRSSYVLLKWADLAAAVAAAAQACVTQSCPESEGHLLCWVYRAGRMTGGCSVICSKLGDVLRAVKG
jgi:hypothetical protein